MPARQPFTALCAAMARPLQGGGRADLHVHTDRSDGTYTPAQVADLARRCGLSAVAVTDHDTVAGIAPARAAAANTVEVIAGVEITAEYRGRELHLLGYFIDPGHAGLNKALRGLREHRVTRFRDMIERLRACGVSVDEGPAARRRVAGTAAPGERAGAAAAGRVGAEAFRRYLHDGGRADVPKRRLPVAEAVRWCGRPAVCRHGRPPGDATPDRVRAARPGAGRGRGRFPRLPPVAGAAVARTGPQPGVGRDRRQRLSRCRRRPSPVGAPRRHGDELLLLRRGVHEY
jgi:hypothetical protein